MNEHAKRSLININGKDYFFSFARFGEYYNQHFDYISKEQRSVGLKYNKSIYNNELADAIHVSTETVKQWVKRNNGPADVQTVKQIAEFFGVNYQKLLVCDVGEMKAMKETTINIETSASDRDVVLKLYEMIVDFIYFETNRYNEALEHPELEDERYFSKLCTKKYETMYKYIDRNSLLITSETKFKLYNIVAELSMCRCGYELPMGRWLRLNPLHYEARSLRDECLVDEEKLADMIGTDIFPDMESAYWAEIDGKPGVYTGYHKNTTVEEVLMDITEANGIDKHKIKLYPGDENLYPGMSYDEMYRFEFVKTITAVFKEDFKELF